MKHIVYLCVFILSLLPLERADAQRHVTVYDPEVSRPVQGFHVWADKLKADTTNVFGSAEVPEKFDTLFLVKPGYVALRIPARLAADTIPVIKDYNNIGEVVVYGSQSDNFKEAVNKWTKEDRVEMALQHPITGIDFNLSDLLSPKRRRDNRNAKKMAKIFKRMEEADNDPIIHAYRKALGIKTKH